jgi:hypothetical protein
LRLYTDIIILRHTVGHDSTCKGKQRRRQAKQSTIFAHNKLAMTGALLVVPRKFLLQHRASTTHAIRTLSSVVKQDGASSLPDHNSSDSNNRSLIPLSSAAKIEGNESQIATITLRPGETLRAGMLLSIVNGCVASLVVTHCIIYALLLLSMFLSSLYTIDKQRVAVCYS